MTKKKSLLNAPEFFIIEGEARKHLEMAGQHIVEEERIEFKEEYLNDLVVRVAIVDHKIDILFKAKEKYKEMKKQKCILSARVFLEEDLIDDALHKNLLEMAELVIEFNVRLCPKKDSKDENRYKHKADDFHGVFIKNIHLFQRISEKKLNAFDENLKKEYSQTWGSIFSESDDSISLSKKLIDLSKKFDTESKDLINFRNKVLAHTHSKDRFETELDFEQYCIIRDRFKYLLNVLSITGTLLSNDWHIYSTSELDRVYKWLLNGLESSMSMDNIGL